MRIHTHRENMHTQHRHTHTHTCAHIHAKHNLLTCATLMRYIARASASGTGP